MIVNQISSFSPSFGRMGSSRNGGGYHRTSGLSKGNEALLTNIENKINDQTNKLNKNSNSGISCAELNQALRSQNIAIGKSLIAVLDAINGKNVDAYEIVRKNLLYESI